MEMLVFSRGERSVLNGKTNGDVWEVECGLEASTVRFQFELLTSGFEDVGEWSSGGNVEFILNTGAPIRNKHKGRHGSSMWFKRYFDDFDELIAEWSAAFS